MRTTRFLVAAGWLPEMVHRRDKIHLYLLIALAVVVVALVVVVV